MREPYPFLFDEKILKRMSYKKRCNYEIDRILILGSYNPDKKLTQEQLESYIYWLEEYRKIPDRNQTDKFLLVWFIGFIIGLLAMQFKPAPPLTLDNSGDSGYESPFGKP